MALADDPPELADDEDAARLALDVVLVVPPPDAEFVAAGLEVDPVGVAPAVVDCDAVAELGLAPVVAAEAVVLLPSVTTPPVVAVVCAKTCVTTTTEKSAA